MKSAFILKACRPDAVRVKSLQHPWDWCIDLLIFHRNQLNVGQYAIPMDPMG